MRSKWLAGGQDRVHHEQSVQSRAEAGINRQSESKRASPILNDQRHILRGNMLDEAKQEVTMEVKAVNGILNGFVRTAEPEEVRCKHTGSRLQ